MTYRSYLVATLILVVGGSLVYAAPRSAHVRKEAPKNVAPQDDAVAIFESLLLDVTEEVTEDGTMMLAGVRRVVTDADGRMHVEINYGGDFDRDMVLAIPRPAIFDESGEFIAVRGPDRMRFLEDHVVYIFDPVTDGGKPASTTRKVDIDAPGVADDCEIKIDIATGEKTLLVSFHQLARTIRPIHPHVDQTPLFINHTLWNREDDRIYFYARGNFSKSGKERINVPFTIKPDGSGLTPLKTFIGGHPEWDYGHRVIGVLGDRQILYDVDRQLVVGTLGSSDIFPKPGADISLSPDGKWFVNGHMDREVGKNFYNIYCRSNGTHLRTAGFSTGQYQRGELRIDPAPRWNRTSDAILVPCWTDEGTRQMFIIRIQPASKREPAD